MTKQKIGIVGVGIMSGGMAKNFLSAGFEVVLWNRTKSKLSELQAQGAEIAETPAAVCEASQIVFEVTADDESSKEVWLGEEGILSKADDKKILIASSTLSAKWVEELAQVCESNSNQFFDMPLTGGRVGAETGNLTLLVGGDEDLLENIKPTLDAIAQNIFYFGDVGEGTKYKLLLNTLQAIHLVGYGEVMKIAESQNMNIDKVAEALSFRPGGKMTEISKESYTNQPDPITFSVAWISKDLGYAQELAMQLETPLLNDVSKIFLAAIEADQAWADWTCVNEPVES